MQRQFIFLATDDPHFENAALNVILETYHGMRRASDIQAACQILGMGTRDIALAIIDLDLNKDGLSLLHILGGCEPEFPILVVGSDRTVMEQDETIAEIAVKSMLKPVNPMALRSEIEQICREIEMSHEEHMRHGFCDRLVHRAATECAGLPA